MRYIFKCRILDEILRMHPTSNISSIKSFFQQFECFVEFFILKLTPSFGTFSDFLYQWQNDVIKYGIRNRRGKKYLKEYKKFTGWPTKMSPFFFDNNFYKNKETIKIFYPQLLERYRILLVETTLESIMFCYTFSVITTVFVPYIALLYDSTAATRTLKFPTALLSISCGIHLIFFLIMSSLVCRLFSRTLSFRYPLRK